ncbi:hypothetical protein CDAR_442011 [Caerostris darwini]|uniref:Transposase IS30-like HTH domain-containing protein n=1 Tax=Caerostris darwini TaxID=1538125 RepID=A0AAV4TJN5_9ARAC|nr:hypothetical protein CDAR_442011 [Caerostris darwini]
MDLKGKEITPEERKIIIKLRNEGKTLQEIGKIVGRYFLYPLSKVCCSSIQRVINSYTSSKSIISKPSSGRLSKLAARGKRYVFKSGILTFVFFCLMDTNIQASFRMKVAEVSRKPKVSAMKLTKSGSFPILERSLITLTDDRRRLDCTPLLAGRMAYHDVAEDPCCSNIRV